MAVLLVEIHQVDEDQPAIRTPASLPASPPCRRRCSWSWWNPECRGPGRRRRSCRRCGPGLPRSCELIEQHALGRRHGVIVAVGGARETAGRAGERARDHAAHFVRSAQNLARRLAHLVEFPERDHFLVRGDLEDAVGRGVDDGRAGAHVLDAEFLDDLGAGGGLVAQRTAADAAFEFAHHVRREAVRIERERLGEMNADHFPMAGGGVLAGRRQGALAVGAGGRRRRGRYR